LGYHIISKNFYLNETLWSSNVTPKRGDKDTSCFNPHKLTLHFFSLSSLLAEAPSVESGGKCRTDFYTHKPGPIFFSGNVDYSKLPL